MRINRAWIQGWGHLTRGSEVSELSKITETTFCEVEVSHFNIADVEGTARITCPACRAGAGDTEPPSMSTFNDGEVTHHAARAIVVSVTIGGVGIISKGAGLLCDPLVRGLEIRDDGLVDCLACLGAS